MSESPPFRFNHVSLRKVDQSGKAIERWSLFLVKRKATHVRNKRENIEWNNEGIGKINNESIAKYQRIEKIMQ